MVRCKFICRSKEECKNEIGEIESVIIKMGAVTEGSEENKKFWKYTPGGELNFYTVNPLAASKIEQGKEYYLDITEATDI